MSIELKSLYLDVEVYGGSNIADAINDMVAMARHLRVGIWADLNGVRTLARPNDDAQELFEEWESAKVNKQSHASTGKATILEAKKAG